MDCSKGGTFDEEGGITGMRFGDAGEEAMTKHWKVDGSIVGRAIEDGGRNRKRSISIRFD